MAPKAPTLTQKHLAADAAWNDQMRQNYAGSGLQPGGLSLDMTSPNPMGPYGDAFSPKLGGELDFVGSRGANMGRMVFDSTPRELPMAVLDTPWYQVTGPQSGEREHSVFTPDGWKIVSGGKDNLAPMVKEQTARLTPFVSYTERDGGIEFARPDGSKIFAAGPVAKREALKVDAQTRLLQRPGQIPAPSLLDATPAPVPTDDDQTLRRPTNRLDGGLQSVLPVGGPVSAAPGQLGQFFGGGGNQPLGPTINLNAPRVQPAGPGQSAPLPMQPLPAGSFGAGDKPAPTPEPKPAPAPEPKKVSFADPPVPAPTPIGPQGPAPQTSDYVNRTGQNFTPEDTAKLNRYIINELMRPRGGGTLIKGGAKIPVGESWQHSLGPSPETVQRFEDNRAHAYDLQQETGRLDSKREAANATFIEGAKEAEEKYLADFQKMQTEYQTRRTAIDDKIKAQLTDLENSKVDPNRYFKNQGTAAQIGSALAVALGAVGSAMSGQKNLAWDTINTAVERDIDSQIRDIGEKRKNLSETQQLYQVARQQLGDDQAARALVKEQQLGIVKRKLDGLVNSVNTDSVRVKGAQIAAAIENEQILQKAAWEEKLLGVATNNYQFSQDRVVGGGGPDYKKLEFLNKLGVQGQQYSLDAAKLANESQKNNLDVATKKLEYESKLPQQITVPNIDPNKPNQKFQLPTNIPASEAGDLRKSMAWFTSAAQQLGGLEKKIKTFEGKLPNNAARAQIVDAYTVALSNASGQGVVTAADAKREIDKFNSLLTYNPEGAIKEAKQYVDSVKKNHLIARGAKFAGEE